MNPLEPRDLRTLESRNVLQWGMINVFLERICALQQNMREGAGGGLTGEIRLMYVAHRLKVFQ